MQIPARAKHIGPLSTWGTGPYPPTALAVFDSFSLGNGDNYGLYWPIGREAHEPIVVETIHDAGGLVPAFSSLDRFLTLTAGLDESDHVEWPTIEADPMAPHALYQAARTALKAQQFEVATSHLVAAVALLPEYAAALSLLATMYIRAGNHADACRVSIRAVRSPPSFGWDADVGRVWNWLSKQSHGPEDLVDDPIWLARNSLTSPPSGGKKENPVYPELLASIEAYVKAGDFVAAITLMQTYAEYMSRETTSFRDRYDFQWSVFQERQVHLEDLLPSGRRAVA